MQRKEHCSSNSRLANLAISTVYTVLEDQANAIGLQIAQFLNKEWFLLYLNYHNLDVNASLFTSVMGGSKRRQTLIHSTMLECNIIMFENAVANVRQATYLLYFLVRECNANVNLSEVAFGDTELISACNDSLPDAIIECLIDLGADMSISNFEGMKPLDCAVLTNYLNCREPAESDLDRWKRVLLLHQVGATLSPRYQKNFGPKLIDALERETAENR